MGSLAARDMAEHCLDIRQLLSWHLRHNHYPPVPLSMIDPCIVAIGHVQDGEYDAMVELPDGVTYKGETSAPADAIFEAHHLADVALATRED